MSEQQAVDTVKAWWHRSCIIRKNMEEDARITGCLATYIPFRRVGMVVKGCIRREESDESGTDMVEYRFCQRRIWSEIACYPREDGINTLPGNSGIVVQQGNFPVIDHEPVQPLNDVEARGRAAIKESVQEAAGCSSVCSEKIDCSQSEASLVFYPVCTVIYTCADQKFKAVVDGVTGKLLFARAPADLRKRYLIAGALVGVHAMVPVLIVFAGWKIAAVLMFLLIIKTFSVQDAVAIVRFGLVGISGGEATYRPSINQKRNVDGPRALCYFAGVSSFAVSIFFMESDVTVTKYLFLIGFVFFLLAVVMTSDSMDLRTRSVIVDETMPESFWTREVLPIKS